MFPKYTLRIKIFIAILSVLVFSLLIIGFVVKPVYEKSLIEERITIISQLQNYAVSQSEKKITDLVFAGNYLADQLQSNPNQVETLLKNLIAINPEIINVRIYSPNSPDELEIHNNAYPATVLNIKDTDWKSIKSDQNTSLIWLGESGKTKSILLIRLTTKLANQVFNILILVDSNEINKTLLNLPIKGEFISGIRNNAETVFSSDSANQILNYSITDSSPFSKISDLEIGTVKWKIITTPFKNFPFYSAVAINDDVIREPVNQLILFSGLFVLFIVIIMITAGWFISWQISVPISNLVKDLLPMTELDFSHEIRKSSQVEFKTVSETLEIIRKTLDRYQKLNIEKIIFEEWKNKFLMNYTDDLIGITDDNNEFTYQNSKLKELFSELSEDTIEVRTISDFFKSDKIIQKKFAVKNEKVANLNIQIEQSEIKVEIRPDKFYYFNLQNVSFTSENSLAGSLLFLHDMTNDRILEQTKNDMMNIVVHELRSPLGTIMGFSEILLRDLDGLGTEQKTSFLSNILKSGNKLSALINRFLDVQRLESGKVPLLKSPVQLDNMIATLIESLHPQAQEKSIRFNFNVEQNIPAAMVSPDLMSEAIQNLMTNAIKYGDENRTIEIDLKTSGQEFIFSIIDYGYGISAEDQQKLFSKFFRVKSNKKSYQQVGTGLGLAYVKEIISRHGGTITLESNPQIGCKFSVLIPVNVQEG